MPVYRDHGSRPTVAPYLHDSPGLGAHRTTDIGWDRVGDKTREEVAAGDVLWGSEEESWTVVGAWTTCVTDTQTEGGEGYWYFRPREQ